MKHSVSAILLAAGLSRRMGRPKQLLPLHGKPVIIHCFDNIFASGIRDIVVVLGLQGEKIKSIIGDFPIKIAFNSDESSDMSGSVRVGLQNISRSSTGVLICLSDQPLISTDTFKVLIEWNAREPEKIIVPVYHSRKGHPVLLPKHIAQEVFHGSLLRDIVNKDAGRIIYVEIPDKGILLDMDTEEDYKSIVETDSKRHTGW
jgi:molybdenum cofactor cytidylyltransferase